MNTSQTQILQEYLHKQLEATFKWMSLQGNLFSACVYVKRPQSVCLLEAISYIILEKTLYLIAFDPHCCQL